MSRTEDDAEDEHDTPSIYTFQRDALKSGTLGRRGIGALIKQL